MSAIGKPQNTSQGIKAPCAHTGSCGHAAVKSFTSNDVFCKPITVPTGQYNITSFTPVKAPIFKISGAFASALGSNK